MAATIAGLIVDEAGYNAAFLFLGVRAPGAFVVFRAAMPETGPQEHLSRQRPAAPDRLAPTGGTAPAVGG